METLAPPSAVPLTKAASQEKPFCGCGLSTIFPVCDGSQMIARTTDPGKLTRCGTLVRRTP